MREHIMFTEVTAEAHRKPHAQPERTECSALSGERVSSFVGINLERCFKDAQWL